MHACIRSVTLTCRCQCRARCLAKQFQTCCFAPIHLSAYAPSTLSVTFYICQSALRSANSSQRGEINILHGERSTPFPLSSVRSHSDSASGEAPVSRQALVPRRDSTQTRLLADPIGHSLAVTSSPRAPTTRTAAPNAPPTAPRKTSCSSAKSEKQQRRTGVSRRKRRTRIRTSTIFTPAFKSFLCSADVARCWRKCLRSARARIEGRASVGVRTRCENCEENADGSFRSGK